MNPAHSDWPTLLDAHLDRRLDAAGRQAFDERLASDPAARAEVALQARIDAALRRQVRPGTSAPVFNRVQAAERAGRVLALQRRHRWIVRVRLAAAAVLLLAVGTGFWWGWLREPDSHAVDAQGYAVQPWRTFEMVYHDEVAGGFKCDWECKTDREFAGTFHKRFGQGLLLGQLPAGVRTLGLSYCNTLSKKTVILLATVDDAKVLVFIDQPGHYDDATISGNSNLHLFKRQVGKLILCELTPLDQPRLLDAFYEPQVPPDWYNQPTTTRDSQPAQAARAPS